MHTETTILQKLSDRKCGWEQVVFSLLGQDRQTTQATHDTTQETEKHSMKVWPYFSCLALYVLLFYLHFFFEFPVDAR